MTASAGVEGTRRTTAAHEAEAVRQARERTEGDPSIVLGSGDSRPAEAPTTTGRADDGDLARIAGVLAFLGDPLTMQRMTQRLVRDMQVDGQEQGIEIQNDRATVAAEERKEALLEAISKAEEAKGWGVFAQVAVRVAAVVSAIALTVAGAFTGGAGVALAAGLIILAFGADLGLALEEAGVDSDVTNAIGIGASVVGTICTFGGTAGAAVAGTAATAAKTAADIALDIAEATIRALTGMSTIVGGAYSHDSAMARADSEAADIEAGVALDGADEMVEEAIAFMESYSRVVEHLTRAAEARDEARSHASRRLA
jgi:hypothetical protein